MSSLTANDPRMERVRHTLKDVQRLSAELASVPQETTNMHAHVEPMPLRSADAMAGQLVVTKQPEVTRRGGRRGVIIGGVAAVASVAAAAVVFAIHPSVLKPYLPEGTSLTFMSLGGSGETAATQAPSEAVAPAATQTAAPNRQAGQAQQGAKLERLPAVRIPNPVASPAGQAVASVVASATAMLASGEVLAARQELLRAKPSENPDVAWTLARSYDPRHLARINGGKNLADVEAAAKWYRVWQKAGQKKGTISNRMDVERLIRGMTAN